MPNRTAEDLTFHTRFDRRAHGCLPVFVGCVFLAVLSAISVIPVKKPEPLKPRGVGEVTRHTDALTDFLVREHSPLPLLQPRLSDPDFEAQETMPLRRELKLLPAPPAKLFPAAPDSAVLKAEDLLALPPTANGKEPQP